MGKHGNHNENEADHHLYEIRDRRGNDVYTAFVGVRSTGMEVLQGLMSK
jgi:hypothetical protein